MPKMKVVIKASLSSNSSQSAIDLMSLINSMLSLKIFEHHLIEVHKFTTFLRMLSDS